MKKKAFTLTELLVAVVIIGVLAAIVLPKFTKMLETRKTSEAEEMMAAVRTEQEARCMLDKPYLTDKDKLASLPKNTGTNFSYTLTNSELAGNGIAATSLNGDYELQIPSYADGRICCTGAGCDKLDKDYPKCSELTNLARNEDCEVVVARTSPAPTPEPTPTPPGCSTEKPLNIPCGDDPCLLSHSVTYTCVNGDWVAIRRKCPGYDRDACNETNSNNNNETCQNVPAEFRECRPGEVSNDGGQICSVRVFEFQEAPTTNLEYQENIPGPDAFGNDQNSISKSQQGNMSSVKPNYKVENRAFGQYCSKSCKWVDNPCPNYSTGGGGGRGVEHEYFHSTDEGLETPVADFDPCTEYGAAASGIICGDDLTNPNACHLIWNPC